MSTPKAEIEVLRQKIADLILKKPEKAAMLLTEWITRGVSRDAFSSEKACKPNKKAG